MKSVSAKINEFVHRIQIVPVASCLLNSQMVVKMTFALDSVGTLTSNSWDASEYDDVVYSTQGLAFAYKLTSAAGSPKITAVLWGSMDNSNFFIIDTLLSAVTSETATASYADMNGLNAPYHRVVLTGIAAGRKQSRR